MVIVINIVLNEREYAESAILNCALSSKPIETLNRVSRYYYFSGHKKSEIQGLLEEFLVKCDPDVNIVKWQNTIDRLVKDSDKYPLVELDHIKIYKSELDICNSLESKQLARLMFTLICLAKYSNAVNPANNNWVNRQDKDIFKLANITTTTRRQSLMFNNLRDRGYIKFSKKVDNLNINVCVIDNEPSEEYIKISDFRNLGNQYMKYIGGPYTECAYCGIVIKKNNNNQKYCKDCAVEVDRQKSLQRWHRTIH